MDFMKYADELQTKIFFNSEGSIKSLGPEFEKRYPQTGAFIVCDGNTLQVAGNDVIRLLKNNGIETKLYLFEEKSQKMLDPDYENVKKLISGLPAAGFIPVAVGSGTINDLVKRAASEKKVPYVCIPTASSVDGYCSFGAALTVDGFKMTLGCDAPEMVIADSDILKTAPREMTSAGYGDLYAKKTAGIDWIMADMLGVESLDERTWKMVHDDLDSILKDSDRIGGGDSRALSGLFEGLCSAGFAMQLYGTSRPASGLEHMLSHYWEMENKENVLKVSHGFKVAVGILISTAVTESFLDFPVETLDIKKIIDKRESWEERAGYIKSSFSSPVISGKVEEECLAKWLNNREMTERLSLLKDKWADIKQKIKNEMIPFKQVKSELSKAGCPVSMEEIGLSTSFLRDSVIRAQMIRSRYIVLEAVYDCGLMNEILNKVENYF